MRPLVRKTGWALILLMTPAIANANAGVPMLAFAWPVMWIGLVPIILVEVLIGYKLKGYDLRNLIKALVSANLLSTFVGVPLSWLALLAIEMLVLYSAGQVDVPESLQFLFYPFMMAWLGPTENPWHVYFAFLGLAVVFCLVSIWVEARIVQYYIAESTYKVHFRWLGVANLVSYILLSGGTGLYLLAQ